MFVAFGFQWSGDPVGSSGIGLDPRCSGVDLDRNSKARNRRGYWVERAGDASQGRAFNEPLGVSGHAQFWSVDSAKIGRRRTTRFWFGTNSAHLEIGM